MVQNTNAIDNWHAPSPYLLPGLPQKAGTNTPVVGSGGGRREGGREGVKEGGRGGGRERERERERDKGRGWCPRVRAQ
jgi:hypothetical protein